MMTRAQTLRAIEEITTDAVHALSRRDPQAVDLTMLIRSSLSEHEPPAFTSCRAAQHPVRLAQLWVVMAALHSSLASGKKISQRELWYHLKPLGIFETAAQVYERIVEVCTVISAWSGFACPREALGVIASARGSMAGALTLVKPEGPQILDRAVHAIPGDPEECLALRFLESRARCVIVVEKDTVFFRLVQDGFIQIMPCVLITSCGFPCLAARALVQHVVQVRLVPQRI